MKITGKTKLGEVMQINPEAGMILFEYGLACVGCGLASMETLEQGCLAHGMKEKQIKDLLGRLNSEDKEENKKIERKKKDKHPRVCPDKFSMKISTEGKIKKLPSKKISSNKLKEMIR
jgi:hybrid cluster-associated redox disulfide protein